MDQIGKEKQDDHFFPLFESHNETSLGFILEKMLKHTFFSMFQFILNFRLNLKNVSFKEFQCSLEI